MNPTQDFFRDAQACLENLVQSKRAELLGVLGAIDHEHKPDTTVVTRLDKDYEVALKEALAKLDANIGFEGEEFGAEGSRETFWLVDPIDGTESFIRGLPFVRNQITLIDNGEPIFAFVYRPVDNETFIAIKGKGATLNGQKLEVSNRSLKRAQIEVYAPLSDPNIWPVIAAVAEKVNDIRDCYEYTYVVRGALDGMLAYNVSGGPWDYAPRALLISEAGGRVANIGSDSYDYRNCDVLATNAVIFDDIMDTIKEASR